MLPQEPATAACLDEADDGRVTAALGEAVEAKLSETLCWASVDEEGLDSYEGESLEGLADHKDVSLRSDTVSI